MLHKARAFPTRWVVGPALLLGTLVIPASGEPVWFDPASAGRAPETLQSLRDAYPAFIGQPAVTITFDELSGAAPVRDQHAAATDMGHFALTAWVWESDPKYHNYESFFAARADRASIARLEIRNDATADFANALRLDDLAFHPRVPEPGTIWLLAGGGLLVSALHRALRRPRLRSA